MRSEVDHTTVRLTLPRQEYMWDLLRPAAVAVKANAVRSAPVHKGFRKDRRQGTYKASFRRWQASNGATRVYRVGTDDPIANLVEWGAHKGRQRGKHILQRAAEMAELRTVPNTKE